MTKSNGYLITIEGGEGAGKSSLISKISQYLIAQGVDVITSREPGGIAIAERIRDVILNRAHTAMDARTEALLYAAARRQHYVEKMVPALNAGQTIVCDRFIDSSLAYQGYARGLGIAEIIAINEFAIEGYWPDLTLYLDIDPVVGLARVHQHADREVNRLDLESLDFHNKVRAGFIQLVHRFPERMVQIDASQTMDEVFTDVKRILQERLRLNKNML